MAARTSSFDGEGMAMHPDDWRALGEASLARVDSWLSTLSDEPGEIAGVRDAEGGASRADLLEGARRDSDGFAFTHRLLDAVIGASDPFTAALGLRSVARELPASMPAVERFAVRAGGLASLGLPWAVLPVARKWLRERVSHLVLSAKVPSDESDQLKLSALRGALRHAQAGRHELLALDGVGVLGEAGARRELDRLLTLARLPEVHLLAVEVGRFVPAGLAGSWALDHDAKAGAARLRELFECANDHATAIVLEASDYRSALLAPQLLVSALDGPELPALRAGLALPAELPESLQTAEALARLSATRVAAGCEPLELTIGVAGFTGGEQIESIQSGLAVPALEQRVARATQLLRVLHALLRAPGEQSAPEGSGTAGASAPVRAVVASEDAHVLAAATVLAERAGRVQSLTLQLRAGTAPLLEKAIAEHGFGVRSRLPLVHPKEFAGAVEYLIAMAAETADADSELALSRALFSGDSAALDDGFERLLEALDRVAEPAPRSRRLQQRELEWSEAARDTVVFYRAPTEPHRFDTGGLTAAVLGLTRALTGAITLEIAGGPLRIPVISESGFANEPDTDGSRFENRQWVRTLLERARAGGSVEVETRHTEPEPLASCAATAGQAWSALRQSERATRVSRLALGIAAARDRLLEVLLAEGGASIPVLDAQVNGTIDAARYLGQSAGGLSAVRGAEFRPGRLALVVADAGVPLDERAEAVLALLATGSGVLLVAHPSVARSSSTLIDEWQAAGLPAALVSLAVPDAASGERAAHLALAISLVADERVDRALVLGQRETALALLRRRPDLAVEGRFREQGVTVVAPSADPVAAARNIVASAFAGAHADAGTARAVVLLGAAARSALLRRSLADAVTSLRVGDALRSTTGRRVGGLDPLCLDLGPLPEPPGEAGLRALTHLGPGEEWLVAPQRLDDEGLLWRPGVRLGVSRDSGFWRDAIGVPVIGVASARTVDEAISLANRIGGGGVAALQSNDPQEMLPWLERVRAAELAIGRPTTGSRIERRPTGGWRAAGMSASVLAGGPNRLQALGSWELREGTASQTLHLRGLAPEVRVLIETSQASLDYQSFDRVRRAALSDALAWRTSFGRVYDVSGLGIERNLLRHWPVSTHVRLAEAAPLSDLVRVLAAGFAAGAPMSLSTGAVLPPELAEFLARQGVPISLERDDDWLERLAVRGLDDDELRAQRIRLIGGDRARTSEWLCDAGDVALWAEPVTMAGPVELLAFLREQSVSISAHRHGLALLPAGIGGWIAELQGKG